MVWTRVITLQDCSESIVSAELQISSTILNCVLFNPCGGRKQDCTLKDFRTALAKKGLIDDRLMTESLGRQM